MVEKIGNAFFGWLQRQRRRLAMFIVVGPMSVLLVYYVLIAADRYVSEAKVVVKNSGDAAAQLGGFSLPFLGTVGSASAEDALHLREFILSYDLLERVDKQLDLRQEFSLKGLDVVQMLPPWATKEDFLELYRKRIDANFDGKTGVLTIVTQGYSPEFAQKFNQVVLIEAERFINELSHRIAREQVEFAGKELERSRKSLDQARDRMLQFQNSSAMLDPSVTADTTQRVIAGLEGQLAAKEVEQNTLGGILQADAAQLVTLRQTISGLKQQIAAEKTKLTSAKGGGLNKVAAEYLDYKAMVEFQADIYRISLASLEKTRLDTARKVKTLAVLSNPQLAEGVKYPRRLYMLGAWLFGLCMLFALVRLTLEIIEDHRD